MPVSLLFTTFVVSEGGVPKEMKVEHAAQGADRRVARSGDPRIAFAIDHFVMAVTSSGMGVRGVRDLRRECGTSSHGGITGPHSRRGVWSASSGPAATVKRLSFWVQAREVPSAAPLCDREVGHCDYSRSQRRYSDLIRSLRQAGAQTAAPI